MPFRFAQEFTLETRGFSTLSVDVAGLLVRQCRQRRAVPRNRCQHLLGANIAGCHAWDQHARRLNWNESGLGTRHGLCRIGSKKDGGTEDFTDTGESKLALGPVGNRRDKEAGTVTLAVHDSGR
jgi:hypothetical protein